jgi:hypothetical protein
MKYLLPILFACVPLFRPECRDDMARSMFDFYAAHEGKPYLTEIAANWLTVRQVGAYCEAEWEHGDLNADGIVNMEDFAIYAGFAGN